jgi:hypothetical protein
LPSTTPFTDKLVATALQQRRLVLAELTSRQDGAIRQQLIELLMCEIMKNDA